MTTRKLALRRGGAHGRARAHARSVSTDARMVMTHSGGVVVAAAVPRALAVVVAVGVAVTVVVVCGGPFSRQAASSHTPPLKQFRAASAHYSKFKLDRGYR